MKQVGVDWEQEQVGVGWMGVGWMGVGWTAGETTSIYNSHTPLEHRQLRIAPNTPIIEKTIARPRITNVDEPGIKMHVVLMLALFQ